MIKNEVIEQAHEDTVSIDIKRKLAAQLHEVLDIKVEVKEEIQEDAFTPAGPSNTQVVSFKYIFDLIQEQDKPSINSKLEFVEAKLLASEELKDEQILDIKRNFAYLKTEFKRRWKDSKYKLSRFMSQNHEWLQGTLEIPRVNKTTFSARPTMLLKSSGECSKRRKTEHLHDIDLNTLPTQSELYQAENNPINSKKILVESQNENVPKKNNPINSKKRLVEALSPIENVPKKSKKTHAKASTIRKEPETQDGDQIAQHISIIADIKEELQEDASTQEVQGSSISSDQFAFLKGKVCEATLNCVKDIGFTTMTEFQAQVIPPLLEGRDLVGATKMGSGKTLAFLIPAIERIYKLKSMSPCETWCIILLPTIEHALKVFAVLKELTKYHLFTYGLAMEYKKNETKDFFKGFNIVVATPGRLLFHLTNTPGFSCKNLQCLVIDAADLIFAKWSNEVKQIIELLPATRQTMIFTTETKNFEALTAFAVKEEPIYVGVEVKSEEATDDQEQSDDSIELSEYEDEGEMLGDNPWQSKDDWRCLRVTADERRRYEPEPSESSSSLDDFPINAGSECESDDYDPDERDLARAPEPKIIRDIPDDDDLEEHLRSKISALERDMDEAHDHLHEINVDFNWKSSFDTFKGVREHFSGPTPGPVNEYATPYDAFVDIWDENIMQHIVLETNRYAKQAIAAEIKNGTKDPLIRCLQEWVETSVNELYVLFGVFISMSLDRKITLDEYWSSWQSSKWSAFIYLRNSRFLLLCKFLHFVDSSTCRPLQTLKSEHCSEVLLDGRAQKLQPIIDLLNAKFTSLYNLRRDICIDESLILFRGYLTWIQSIQIRASRFDMKSSEICEVLTGYLYKFNIYTGTTADAPTTDAVTLGGETTKVLNKLMDGLWNRGHCLTMGNFYNSPALARYLKRRGTDCIGTLRPTRRHVPASIRLASDARRGTSTSRHSGDVSITSWKDSKPIIHISTFYDDSTIREERGRQPCLRPIVAKGYERRMKLLDLKNQQLSYYFSDWSSGFGRWSINIFNRLFNASVHNAYIMFNQSQRRRNFAVMTQRKFRYKLSKALIKNHRGATRTRRD